MRTPSVEFAYGIALVATPHLIMVRIPLTGKPGRRRGAHRAREFQKAYRGMMGELGIKREHWLSLDTTSHPDAWDKAANPLCTENERAEYMAHATKLDDAFAGVPRFAEFHLFDYRDGVFVKVRGPIQEPRS